VNYELSNGTASICRILALLFRETHNPKVVSSNLTPATTTFFLSVSSANPATIRICRLRAFAHTANQRRTPVGDVRRVLFLSSATPNSTRTSEDSRFPIKRDEFHCKRLGQAKTVNELAPSAAMKNCQCEQP
jgi:hypothetical protein